MKDAADPVRHWRDALALKNLSIHVRRLARTIRCDPTGHPAMMQRTVPPAAVTALSATERISSLESWLTGLTQALLFVASINSAKRGGYRAARVEMRSPA